MTAAVTVPRLSLDEALVQLLADVPLIEQTESVATMDADGRVLARSVVSALQVPGADNSAMDGYAVRCADVATPGAELWVTQRIAAGTVGGPLLAGQAARIFTGAPVPPGADAVVMQEDCVSLDGTDARVRVGVVPQAGQWIRKAGEDVARGGVVLERGCRLAPAHLGLAASVGMAQLEVLRRPSVALFSTGDELVMPGDCPPQDLPPGAIYNSNRFFLNALLRRMGLRVTDFGIVPDRLDATQAALQAAAESHDVILTSGGVSVGEEDHVKAGVQALGQLDLWQIAIKPGKPFAKGRIGAAHFLGLPGNPVSSLVTFLLLVRPFLLRLQGQPNLAPLSRPVRADFDWPKADRRREFLRVRFNANGGLDLFSNQSSGVLTSAVWADGLVDNPAGGVIRSGDIVQFLSFAELGA